MKYILMFSLFLTGSIVWYLTHNPKNLYIAGCKDGTRTWVTEVQNSAVEESILEKGCANIYEFYIERK